MVALRHNFACGRVSLRYVHTCLAWGYVLGAIMLSRHGMQPSCAFALVVRAHHLHLCVVVATALAYIGCAIWGGSCFSVPRMAV